MNYIESFDSLQKLINQHPEIVIFPVGIEGSVFLDFLVYTKLSNRVCCITTEKWTGERKFIRSITLLPSNCVVHFRDTASFIIAAPRHLHSNFYQEFTKFGCKNVFVINEETVKQLQNVVQNIINSGQMLSWFLNNIENKVISLENRVAEQNEVCAVNTRAFANYRNCFRDKRVVIVATGPTAKYYKPIKDTSSSGGCKGEGIL